MIQPEVVEISRREDFDALRASWNALAHEVPGSSYFQSADWVAAWWEHLAGRPETTVATWSDADGGLLGLAAMSKVRERLHPAIPVGVGYWTNAGTGTGAADHAGPLVTEEVRDEVHRWLSGLEGSVVIRNVSGEPKWLPDHAEQLEVTPCPRLAIPPGEDPIGRSAKYRKRLRRNSRVLRERGLEFAPVDGPSITDEIMQRLVELHDARAADQEWGSTFTAERLAFHKALIDRSEVAHGPGVMLATKGEEIVGVLYGFWWRDSFSYFQTGWDPQWRELSLGTALVYEMVLHARTRGATVFDFLRGAEEYKYRFGAQDLVDHDWLVAGGLTGRLLSWKARLR